MRPVQQPLRGAFYYLTSYILAILSLLVFYPFIYAVVISSIFFIFAAWIPAYSKIKFLAPLKIQIPLNITSILKLWGIQIAGFLITFIFASLWNAEFPHYGDTKNILISHISFSCFTGMMLTITMLLMLQQLKQRFQRPLSIILFFPQQKMETRLALYGNTWFRKSTMLTSLICAGLSLWLLFPDLLHYSTFLIISFVIAFIIINTPSFYRGLQICIKRWQLNFASILTGLVLLAIGLTLLQIWFTIPLANSIPMLNLKAFTMHAPLIAFWGFAICISTTQTFFLASRLSLLTAKQILYFSLANPGFWLLFLLDIHYNILDLLQHLPMVSIKVLSFCTLVLSLIWLNSAYLAKLNVTFFSNHPDQHQGPTPRILVKHNLVIALTVLLTLSAQAAFWLQVELLTTAGCLLVSDIIAVYLFYFRLVNYEH